MSHNEGVPELVYWHAVVLVWLRGVKSPQIPPSSEGVFVRDDCLGGLTALSAAEAYQTPKYGGHMQSDEVMIVV